MSKTEETKNDGLAAPAPAAALATSPAEAPLAKTTSWRSMPERGTVLGIQIVGGIYRLFGRRAAMFVVWWVVIYYAALHFPARRASKAYLARMGLPTSFASIHRHFFEYGCVTLDRYLFMLGRVDEFDIHLHGHEHIERLAGKGDTGAPGEAPKKHRGALLLGSHIGSFEAMRGLAKTYDIPLSIIADFRNAKRINGVLEALAPGSNLKVIGLDPTRATSMLDVKACIDRGELVALLGDRSTPEEPRAAEVTFLGDVARLPTGPYWLAHMLACPVYVVAGLFTAPNRYDLYCEPFAESVRLPRQTRAVVAAELAQKYAQMLETYARKAPYNWFNFFDFWRSS